MNSLKSPFKVLLFADGANKDQMLKRYHEGLAKGFTTNPSLMAKAGIRDYAGFARDILKTIHDLPISFEVFSDEFSEMEKQAQQINSWGANVNVKVPITNTKSEPSLKLIRNLFDQGMKLNITAIFTPEQLKGLKEVMKPEDDAIISIFAGRIADTGIDPMPLMRKAVADFASFPKAKILWASPREALNIYQADEVGCHIITLTDELLGKVSLKGKNLMEYSLETVKTFYKDATQAGFQL
ncbi:MAG: transaldolase [Bdellovibrionia bacterium]